MRPHLQGLLMVACALVGLGLTFEIVTIDAPVCFGMAFIDYPDSARPGHMKGVIVSTPELLGKSLLAVALLYAAWWLWRCLRRSDPPHRPS